MRDRIVFMGIGGFLAGVLFASFYTLGVFGIALMLVIGFGVLILAYFDTNNNASYLLFTLVVLSFSLGVSRMLLFSEDPTPVMPFLGASVVLHGRIIEEPDVRENATRLIVSVNMINDAALLKSQRMLISTSRSSMYGYGDQVRVEGKIEFPENFETDTGRTFDYVSFLKKDNVHFQVSFAAVEIEAQGGGNPIVAMLIAMKHRFLEAIGRVIPDPEASLLGGLLVGAKTSLGKDLTEEFRNTGIIHIVVLSGYNLSIVAEAIMYVLQFLPRLFSLSLGAVSIILFAIMTGGSATVIRASIMALLVLLARATGRTYDMVKALGIAAFLMVLYEPYTLVFDPSFQLSFLATLGLIVLSPLFDRYFARIPEFLGLKGVLIATIATQIIVLPLILYMSGSLSLVSLPVNLLVLVAVPFAMLAGFIAGTIALVSSVLSLPFAYLTYGILHYILAVVHAFAALPFASLELPVFPWWLMLLLYILIGLAIRALYVGNAKLVR